MDNVGWWSIPLPNDDIADDDDNDMMTGWWSLPPPNDDNDDDNNDSDEMLSILSRQEKNARGSLLKGMPVAWEKAVVGVRY